MDLVERVYRVTDDLPRSETYGLASHMQRAAVSIPSNIAEGHRRSHTREYLQHVAIAHGSLAELETQIEIALRLGYLSSTQADELQKAALSLSRQLTAPRRALGDRLPNAQSPLPTPNPPRPCSENS